MQIIPAIDIRDGHCVRLLYGDYDAETRYDVDPVERAKYYASIGLAHLHIVDLDGARDGTPRNAELIERMVSASGVSVQVGGGIRTAVHIQTLLDHGVERVVIGSTAVKQPELVVEWFAHFGASRIVLALDVRFDNDGQPLVTTDAWQSTSAVTLNDLIDQYLPAGLRHVLCTDISRDGALSGPSIELYRTTLARYPQLQLQASGGVSSIEDLAALRDAGLPAAITGKALLEGKITAEQLVAC
ncbi:MAG: 1-(5-phosphoribosyl)-5-[(5-phosphoribosylamino)methylideneamino]imidazole-4-carboxamide isomerase [Pseudomonadota bacterium]